MNEDVGIRGIGAWRRGRGRGKRGVKLTPNDDVEDQDNKPDDTATGAVLPRGGTRRSHRLIGGDGSRDDESSHAKLQEGEGGRNHFHGFFWFVLFVF